MPRSTSTFLLLAFVLLLALPISSTSAQSLPTPEEFLGFRVGADRQLADYHQILEYLQILSRSDRLELRTYGESTEGNPLVMAVISSPQNLANVEHFRQISARLANPDDLSAQEAQVLIEEGRTILMVVCNIHSSEIGPSQMAIEWAYDLVSTQDKDVLSWLDEVILLLVPSVNPDGQILVTDWYRKYVGTPFEGGPMPWLYHKYAGHDLNRDWYMLTQRETRALNRVAYHEWHPQILVDQHQMGTTGPRVFVPPYANPVAANVHPLIWRLSGLVGHSMSLRLEEAGKAGVIDGFQFDGYWVGGTRSTCFWKNTVGILTEVASARIASPIHIDRMELRGDRKGLAEYQAQVNFPNPWRGGWWRLSDIVDYHLIFSNAVLETSALHRKDFLRDKWVMSASAMQTGRDEAPFAYVVPVDQQDVSSAARMVEVLAENGVRVYRATQPFQLHGERFPVGSIVVPTAQPYRSFIKEMMERQTFPEVLYAPGSSDIHEPYDVTGWTLPLLMGVDIVVAKRPLRVPLEELGDSVFAKPQAPVSDALALSATTNASHRVINRLLRRGYKVWRAAEPIAALEIQAGTWMVEGAAAQAMGELASEEGLQTSALQELPGSRLYEIESARIGLVQPWRASMDAGWTRWVLEQFDFELETLDPKRIHGATNRHTQFDIIIVPSLERADLVDGDRNGAFQEKLPAEYDSGIGARGLLALRAFVEQGGTLLLLAGAGDALAQDLNLPVRNAVKDLDQSLYSFPGTLVRMQLDTQHPLAYGMPEETAAYQRQGPAWVTQPVAGGMSRAVVARFPEEPPTVLSGWARGREWLQGRGAVVEFAVKEGKVILVAPRIQHRGQTHATFKLLFNAVRQSAAHLRTAD